MKNSLNACILTAMSCSHFTHNEIIFCLICGTGTRAYLRSWSLLDSGQYRRLYPVYIYNCTRPITSHHSYHVTVQYPTVLYGWYWTVHVDIARLSVVDLPCKVNHKSRWPRKASEWGTGSFRLIVCKQNTSVNILFIIKNIITNALRVLLIK